MNSTIKKLEYLSKSNNKDATTIIARKLYESFISNNFHRIKELSQLCHVHESTITVFAKKFGYSGYRELLFVLKLERSKYEVEQETREVPTLIGQFSAAMIKHLQNCTDHELIINLVSGIKLAQNVFIYSSYQLQDLGTFFYENLSLKTKNVLYNKTKLYAYKNINFVSENDLAIFLVSGQDNEMLEHIFQEVSKKTQNVFLFTSESQLEKFSGVKNTKILEIIGLPNQNIYRHLLLSYYINMIFYLL